MTSRLATIWFATMLMLGIVSRSALAEFNFYRETLKGISTVSVLAIRVRH
jgi:preprotein translocase subunit SecG